MPFDRFLIAPINSGLQTNLKPWLIMDDAFTQLNNCYVFRGRVRKRFGSSFTGKGGSGLTAQLTSRVRINLGNTDGSGNISATVPGSVFKIGQLFSIGTEIFTVYQTGTPAVMYTTGSSTVHTYNTTTGAVVINGAAAGTATYFYPAEPILGLTIYESGTFNNQPAFAFDTQFAYTYDAVNTQWIRSGTALFHGSNLNYFWMTNWQGLSGTIDLFVSNFQVTNLNGASAATDDPIWTYNGTSWLAHPGSNANGFFFLPAGGARTSSPYIVTARIILPFKNRLVLLNTVECDNSGGAGSGTNTNYPQRCRFSFNGSPFANNAWYEPNQTDNAGGIAAGAGYIDAATDEQILGAEFIKDRLIVFFQNSTWELAYTGNEIQPFIWQKINTELGTESQNATVPFDKVILTVGNVGVHACNGANVERIDNKIPNQVFEIQEFNSLTTRIDGVRDYFNEMVYWCYPSDQNNVNNTFCNKVLVYNYQNGSWAIFDDCFTVFGYFEQQVATTWANQGFTWEESEFEWDSGVLEGVLRQIIGGNQQGFILLIDDDVNVNAPAMQLTNMATNGAGINLTIVDHTLNYQDAPFIAPSIQSGDYIQINNAQGVSGVNGNIYQVTNVVSSSVVTINPASFTGTYTGGGTITRVSNINLQSKQWNPYIDKGRNVYLARIDFGVERTASGQITVDYSPSSTQLSMVDEATATGAIMGTGVLETSPYSSSLYPLEQYQDRLWHPIYFQSTGECIQLNMYMNSTQITSPTIAFAPFVLEGIVLHTSASSERLQ